MEWRLLGELAFCLLRAGEWTESAALAAAVPEDQIKYAISIANTLVEIAFARGDSEAGRRVLSQISDLKDSADVQDRSSYAVLCSLVLRSEGRFEEALAASGEAVAIYRELGTVGPETLRHGLAGSLTGLSIRLGDRLGLYRALADHGPQSSAELADHLEGGNQCRPAGAAGEDPLLAGEPAAAGELLEAPALRRLAGTLVGVGEGW